MPYTTAAKDFEGYTLKTTPSNKDGFFTVEDQVVNYYYSLNRSQITYNVNINHIYDNNDVVSENKVVNELEHIDLGSWLKTSHNDIGYEFDYIDILPSNYRIDNINSFDYVFTSDNNFVNIYYKKEKIVTEPIIPVINKPLVSDNAKLVQVGNGSLTYLVVILLLNSMVLLVYKNNRIKLKKKN